MFSAKLLTADVFRKPYKWAYWWRRFPNACVVLGSVTNPCAGVILLYRRTHRYCAKFHALIYNQNDSLHDKHCIFSFLAFLKPADTGTRLALAFTNAWRREKKLHLFYYTSSTPYFSPKSAATVKKNCGKNVISAVRFFSRLSSSNFLNLLRLQPGLFFYFRLRSFLLFIYSHSQSSFIRRQTAKIAAWNWDQKMFTLFRNSRTTMAC